MQIELSKKEFRRLLDLVYMGNWVLNSTRGDDRFQDYDKWKACCLKRPQAGRHGDLGGDLPR